MKPFELKTNWLVLANSVKAEIYQIHGKEHTHLKTLEHPESRLKSKDITSDKPGHYKASLSGHGAYVPPTNPHEETHKQFAHEIAHYLETGRQQNQYHDIILCAEPHFYGLINQSMTESVRAHVIKIIEKDYIPLPKPKLAAVIQDLIFQHH